MEYGLFVYQWLLEFVNEKLEDCKEELKSLQDFLNSSRIYY